MNYANFVVLFKTVVSTTALHVDPTFLYVREDWPIGKPLNVTICAENANNYTLTIVNGGETMTRLLRLQRIKDKNNNNQSIICWDLLPLVGFDADVNE
jgi:hypothetical protein